MSVWVEIVQYWQTVLVPLVTLHVSVWVEILFLLCYPKNMVSRSTWACELKYANSVFALCVYPVTLHVSVWVEILRVYWKLMMMLVTLHVSVWVEMMITQKGIFVKQSRSTWACELKLNIHVFIVDDLKSRSTWACELKYANSVFALCVYPVTLHVSVWVEIVPCW